MCEFTSHLPRQVAETRCMLYTSLALHAWRPDMQRIAVSLRLCIMTPLDVIVICANESASGP